MATAPVVLLHGIPGTAAIWDPVVARLAPRHAVHAPDLVGFGTRASAAAPDQLAPPAQAAALAAELDSERVSGAVVVGHDYGGPVALTLAAQRPDLVSALVLTATNAFPDTPIPLPIRAVTWPVIGAVAERLLFSGPSLALMVRGGVDIGGSAERRSTRVIFASSLRLLRERYEPVEAALRAVDIPVLVCWGDRDPFFPLAHGERTAEAARHGRIRVYEGCGHFVPAERPDDLAADIEGLVRELRAAA